MSITLVEAAIVDRLKAKLIDAAVPANSLVEAVYAHQEYADVPEAVMVTPSVAVIYNGYTPGPHADAAGTIQSVTLNWIVVVNVSSAQQTARGDGVRLEASPIIDAVFAALLGYRPLPKFKPLLLEPAPGAVLTDAGFGYYPLAFSTTATYRGKP